MNIKPEWRLDRLHIGQRLGLLSGISIGALVLVIAFAALGLTWSRTQSSELHHKVEESGQVVQLRQALQRGFVDTLNQLLTGKLTWEEAAARVGQARQNFAAQWSAFRSEHAGEGEENPAEAAIQGELERSRADVEAAFSAFEDLASRQSQAELELFVLNDLDAQTGGFIDALNRYSRQLTQAADNAFAEVLSTQARLAAGGAVLTLSILAMTVWLALAIRRSIIDPVARIGATVSAIAEGQTDVRTRMEGDDELAQLAQALDRLLDDRVATLIRIEQENEQLNDSIIELLEGTSRLAERDFNTRLTVREDITGPVADSLNLVTDATADALLKIRQIGDLVEVSGNAVAAQSHKVSQVAAQERMLVEQMVKRLEKVVAAMRQVSDQCRHASATTDKASASTGQAFETVGNTVRAMAEIRDVISETEKRIKRLSERSQEISTITDMIGSISERTHVLALNASMQAAAAGEAGRGFAVVADEVQRLAENSRNSTAQISALVRNIQSETAAAVEAMNRTIGQVVQGSRLAEEAGQAMQTTQTITAALVDEVGQVSASTTEQADALAELRKQADRLIRSTRLTDQELRRQAAHIGRLKWSAQHLTETVTLFSLPERELPPLDITADGKAAEVAVLTDRADGPARPAVRHAV
ncbi:methyl-accepting chemotaxis protein [Hahella sp. SMD15-11]|uniref:Methyl-accepting chemotaxis protein n=1 Tax=Thermohahella caldifontis TaxID=3142973 RepID=A0AB39UWF0_9GAMM